MPGVERPRLKEGEADAILKKLAGTWKNEWKAAGTTTTWKITENGAAEETVERKDEKETTALKLDFAHVDRMGVTRGTTRQDYTFLLSGDVFYASSNLLSDIHRIPDLKRFTIPSEWDWLVVEDGVFTVIGDSGVSARAEMKSAGGEISFKWRYPGKNWDGTRKYAVVGDRLVHSGAQAFRKQ